MCNKDTKGQVTIGKLSGDWGHKWTRHENQTSLTRTTRGKQKKGDHYGRKLIRSRPRWRRWWISHLPLPAASLGTTIWASSRNVISHHPPHRNALHVTWLGCGKSSLLLVQTAILRTNGKQMWKDEHQHTNPKDKIKNGEPKWKTKITKKRECYHLGQQSWRQKQTKGRQRHRETKTATKLARHKWKRPRETATSVARIEEKQREKEGQVDTATNNKANISRVSLRTATINWTSPFHCHFASRKAPCSWSSADSCCGFGGSQKMVGVTPMIQH